MTTIKSDYCEMLSKITAIFYRILAREKGGRCFIGEQSFPYTVHSPVIRHRQRI